MTHMRHPDSANRRYQAAYSRYFLRALIAAVILTALFAALTPPYIPAPYQLQAQEFIPRYVPEDPFVPPEVPDLPFMMPFGDIVPDLDGTDGPPPITDPGGFPVPPPLVATPRDFVPLPEVPPRVVHAERVVYPEIAKRGNATGWVKVRVTISEEGRVIQAVVHESRATQAIEDAALAAAMKYLFTPAMQRNRPVRSQVILQFSFALN